MSERTAEIWPTRSKRSRTASTSWPTRSATASRSVWRSSSVHSMLSASATARRARSTFTAGRAVSRSSWLNVSGSVPVMARYCSSCMPWAWSRMARSCRRSCISWPISGSGSSSVTSAASASPTFSRSAIWACALRTRVIRSARLARSSATRLELGGLRRPLVGELGEHLLLHVLDGELELELALLVGIGVGGGEAEGGAGLGPDEVLVDLRGDGTGADRVAVVVGGETGLRPRRRACRRCRS